MKKALQIFDPDYLKQCRQMSPDAIINFLENYRSLLYNKKSTSKLISIKVPENLLVAFKTKAACNSTPYQTQIKKLMKLWVD